MGRDGYLEMLGVVIFLVSIFAFIIAVCLSPVYLGDNKPEIKILDFD